MQFLDILLIEGVWTGEDLNFYLEIHIWQCTYNYITPNPMVSRISLH